MGKAARGPIRRGRVSGVGSGAVRRGRAIDLSNQGPIGDPGVGGPPAPPGPAGATGAAGVIGPPAIANDDDDRSLIYPPPLTLTPRLDQAGGAGGPVIGDVLVRDTNGWRLLNAPAAGLFLGGNGPGVVPTYQAPFGVASPFYVASQFQYFALTPTLVVGVGIQNPTTLTGAQAPAASFADAYYTQFLDTTTLSSSAAIVGATGTNVGPLNFLWDFDVIFIITTDGTSVASALRYWFGFSNGNPGNVDALGANSIMFRYSTSAGDGGWVGVVYDGTQVVSATVATIAANTRYALRIRRVGSTVFFSVNGGLETSIATHVPANDVYRIPVMTVHNPTGGAGTARSFYFSRMFCSYGT